jgi:DNA-binding NarL/FixJ family response regulator
VESANSSVGGRAWSDDDVIAPALLRTDRRHDLDRDHDRDLRHGPLTARQLEIATLIARGLTNEQIADELVLTRGTVGNHIGHILRRLGAKNRAQVAAWMVRRTVDERAVKSG